MNGHSQLRERYRAVQDAIKQASGSRTDVQLLAISKTFAAADVLALADLGQRQFGENYLQEALDKMAVIAAKRPDLPLEWHFVGPIQSNKTRPIAEHFAWVHSVDRLKVAQRLSAQRPKTHLPLNVCIQVNVSGEQTKSGCAPDETLELAQSISTLPGLALRGLMAIPEPTDDLSLQSERFASLRQLRDRIVANGVNLDTLSMGMSADMAIAIAQGASIVRVGSAIFGSRTKPLTNRNSG